MPGLWDESAPRSQRRAEHLAPGNRAQWGRAGPSGVNVARWGERSLRIRADSSSAECQEAAITQPDSRAETLSCVAAMVLSGLEPGSGSKSHSWSRMRARMLV